jgi:hypothetical protein
MRYIPLLTAFTVLLVNLLKAQGPDKITGPLGVYHVSPGYSYKDTNSIDSVPMEQVLRFGEMAIPDQAVDYGMNFIPQLDSCQQWNANRIFGIIQPPTEDGVYNRPDDTVMLAPYDQIKGPGMIQGGRRFSQLSQQYSGFCGVILDDWNQDTAITHKVYDAVKGKPVDAEGNVIGNCTATTPYNKLYCVIYYTNPNASAMPYVDGLSYWYWAYQNCCYTNFDSDITALRQNWPAKEILMGIYIKDSYLGWTTPESVQYLLAHSIDRYDNGDINGVIIFRGPLLASDFITLEQWKQYNLPPLLDSLYYPYLGAGQGKINDCNTGKPITDAFVNVFCKGRVSGDTMMRSRRKTDNNGEYQFGLWAGNRNTDSTYYWLIAERPGYITDTVGFWIKRNSTVTIPPPISLCPQTLTNNNGNSTPNNMFLFPNPTNGIFTVKEAPDAPTGELQVYNMRGQKLYETTQACSCTPINLSSQPDGTYLVIIKTGATKITQKRLLLIQH